MILQNFLEVEFSDLAVLQFLRDLSKRFEDWQVKQAGEAIRHFFLFYESI